MKILLLNQAFHPDVVSSGQHLTDLALALVERGHQVTVVTSRRAYDDPNTCFPGRETWRGVDIVRIASTGFGKATKWKRALDFGSFLACCLARIAMLPRHDVVLAMTSPPLISFLGAWHAKLRRSRFFYWVLDLNPDEAVAAGWLNARSPVAKLLEKMSRFSLRSAEKVIALDGFMRDRIVAKGIDSARVAVIPPWSHDDAVRFDPVGRKSFRKAHGLENKYVVMYSGNHSPCHPLDSLLAAAVTLQGETDFAFCFVGGGSEFRRIKEMIARDRLSNVVCLPYQPLDRVSGSLSAADLHVVVMGEPFVGLVHPCKIYNVLNVGAPVLFIGPKPSHLSDILDQLGPNQPWGWAPHGNAARVVEQLQQLRQRYCDGQRRLSTELAQRFSRRELLPRLIAELEGNPRRYHQSAA